MAYSTNVRKIRISRQDACKPSSRRFIDREQLATDKEFIEIDNVSYTIASRLIFNTSLDVFNQVWMHIDAMDYDALITAYTDDVIIKYDDEPKSEKEDTVVTSEPVVEEVPNTTEEEPAVEETETEEVPEEEPVEEATEEQPAEEEVVEEKKEENPSAPKQPQKYAKFKRKK